MLLLMYHIFAPPRLCVKSSPNIPLRLKIALKFPKFPLDTPVLFTIIDRMTIDATIQRLTNDGEVVAQFLVDTLQGNTRDATVSHRIKSAEWLAMFGRLIPESAIPKYASVRPRPKSEPKPAKAAKPDKRDKKPKVTEKQILHFDIARLIKQETNDGETIIEFLIRVISKIEETGENFTPAVRMRAARELLVRGFGSTIPGVRRILSGKTEELDSYLSKIVREYTNYGADSIRFLVETMENKDPEAESRGAASFIKLMRMRPRTKPAEGFTASHRVWAACELLRRAYDIKTDHITYEDIQAYWSARTPADARKDDPGSPAASLKGFTPEYLETQAAKMRAAADSAAAEQIDAHAKQKRDAAKQPADANTPSDTPSRAARRREQRAARKAQKRAAGEQPVTAAEKPAAGEQPAAAVENIAVSEKSAAEQRAAGKTLKRIPRFPNRRRTREDVAEMLAFKAELESRRVDDLEPPRRRKAKKRKAAAEQPAAAAENIAADEQPGTGEQLAVAAENIAVSEKSADEQRDDDKQPAANAKNIAAEKPDADAEQRDVDKQPAANAEKRNAAAEKPDVATEQRDNAKQPAAANIAAKEKSATTTEQRDADKQPAAAEKRNPDAEKPDVATKQPDYAENPDADKQRDAKQPANANTPSDTPDRAARRRQKRDARKAEKRAVSEQPAAAANIAATEKRDGDKMPVDNAAENPDADNTPSATTSRAARRRQKRAARKAQKRANPNPMPGAIHVTDVDENTVVFSHEPLSIEEWKRLRKTLAHPDNIPANARSP